MFDLSAYQKWTRETSIYPDANTGNLQELMYAALGLASEAGEFAGFVKKVYRDGDSEALRASMTAELGDVMWYAARLAETLGVELQEVMAANQKKIISRQQRGKISGSGDLR